MSGKTLVNLTPHHITEVSTGITLQPSGIVCRVDVDREVTGEVSGIPIYKNKVIGEVTGLPAPKKNTLYVVSGVVKDHIKNRDDVVKVGRTIKDANKRVVGCIGFVK